MPSIAVLLRHLRRLLAISLRSHLYRSAIETRSAPGFDPRPSELSPSLVQVTRTPVFPEPQWKALCPIARHDFRVAGYRASRSENRKRYIHSASFVGTSAPVHRLRRRHAERI